MDGAMLREAFEQLLPGDVIEELGEQLGVVERRRKLELATLVWSLVLSSGSDDSGRLADAYSTYLDEADEGVVRASFYQWFSDTFAELMETLTQRAMARVRACEPHLPEGLAGLKDWILVDAETVTLRDAFAERYPSTSERPGIKIHCLLGWAQRSR